MASIRTRQKQDGTESHTVTWREPGGEIKSRTYSTHAQAQELADFLSANGNSFKLAARAKKAKDDHVPTVQEWVQEFIDQKRNVLARSRDDDTRKLRDHITGTPLGKTPITDVTRAQVIAWVEGLRVHTRAGTATDRLPSQKTIKNVHSLLSGALRRAVEEQKIPINPALRVLDADLGQAREPVFISTDQLARMIERVDEPHRLLVQMLGYSGLRFSEATALRKRDVTFSDWRATIDVSRAWKRSPDGDVIGTPKTRKGRRRVACSRELSAALRERWDQVGADDLLFQRSDGSPVPNGWFHREAWIPLIDRLTTEGVFDRRPWVHELRKAHTSHLLQAGVPVHVVQARLGHEDPQTTLRIYAQMSTGDDIAAADALD